MTKGREHPLSDSRKEAPNVRQPVLTGLSRKKRKIMY